MKPAGIPSLRGHDHTGITVPDLEQAIAFFVDVVGCDLATRLAPWGLQLELISYPNGMAYEAGARTVLWSPKDPGR